MSTKEFGCFICKGKSLDYDGNCNICGAKVDVSKNLLSEKIESFQVDSVIGRGFYGWTLKVWDGFQFFALKIIPSFRIEKWPTEEVSYLAKCSDHRNIAKFISHFETNISINGSNNNYICMVFEYIDNAKTLYNFLNDSETKISRKDVYDILRGITHGLWKMTSQNIWHNDLHDNNILIRRTDSMANLPERFEPKIIDFGSVKYIDEYEPQPKNRSDWFYVSKHINNLLLKFEQDNWEVISPRDRAFSHVLRQLSRRLIDGDKSRREYTPAQIANELYQYYADTTLHLLYPDFDHMLTHNKVSFKDPLENTNALALAPQDIPILFRDSLDWQSKIQTSEPILVTGPRGCGKTMLLRYLSVNSQARLKDDEKTQDDISNRLEKSDHIGFLVSVSQLRTPFLRSFFKVENSRNNSLQEDYCREYITSHLLLEVLRSLIWLQNLKVAGIAAEELSEASQSLSSYLSTNSDTFSATDSADELVRVLEKRIINISCLTNIEEFKPSALSFDNILEQATRCFKLISFIKNKRIYYLFDDYSHSLLPDVAIFAYNPVLFRLSSDFSIKVSSEGDGPTTIDSLGRRYQEGREYSKCNLGAVYFLTNERECVQFFDQMLNARFEGTGVGSLSMLKSKLAEHKHYDSFSKYICAFKRPGDAKFYGYKHLISLCSGDVSYIIELMKSIIGGQWKSSRSITPSAQNKVIKRFAIDQLNNLKSVSEFGFKLHDFANRLGILIKDYLLTSCESQKYDERLRIEVEGNERLSDMAKVLERKLIEHSVLIPGGFGKDRQGRPTKKYYFRRLYAPCFPFSPDRRRNCIAITWKTFDQWLCFPEKISKKSTLTSRSDSDEPKMFGEL